MTTAKLLRRTARLYGIQAQYRDGFDRPCQASTQAVLSVLKTLGAPVNGVDDLSNALRERGQALWRQGIEPVVIAWNGAGLNFKLRLPLRLAEDQVKFQIVLEDGQPLSGICKDESGPARREREVEGERYVTRKLTVPDRLPLGYHRLHLDIGAEHLQAFLLSAPRAAYGDDGETKRWGLFCPLYALHSERSWGAGDFSDLAAFLEFTRQMNGAAVATLPLLASFLDEPFDPSPYAPVSRLFWNEFFLDVGDIPEVNLCAGARQLLDSDEFRRDLDSVRAQSLIDYRTVMALKRRVLEQLCGFLLGQESERREDFERYTARHPSVKDYAAFRAKVERERTTWPHWDHSRQDGLLTGNDYDRSAKQYHLFVQWQCEQQVHALKEKANGAGTALYLDFPLGVNRDGYDVWRERNLFALAASGGAPPDGLFVKGQDWGFPPLHPETIRGQGYRYYVDCLRHHMACAGILRMDHVMGLHRAFWIPEGFGAADGLYVRYHAEEFYAILNLESQRHHVRIVGENLGTVPGYVNVALARNRFLTMHVGQFGVQANPQQALDRAPKQTVASLNTHDTATFMGFWLGEDIQDRVALGLLSEIQAQTEHQYRAAQREALIAYLQSQGLLADDADDPGAVIKGWLAYLARQDEEFLLVNLEDLWLEPAPQNVPGTWQERPNWQRRARLSLEQFCGDGPVREILKTIRDNRNQIG